MAHSRRTQRSTDGPGLAAVPDDSGTDRSGTEPSGTDADEAGLELLGSLRQALDEAGAPDEVMQALEGVTDPGQILHRLGEAGVLPAPEQSLSAVLDGWRPLLARGATPLDAELCGMDFVAIVRSAALDPAEVPLVLEQMIAQAEQHGGPEALAMLRVLAVVGPPPVRPVASAGADRLVSDGLEDRPWVKRLGAPTAGQAFGYADDGCQETLMLTFRYGRTSHAVAVLIDHDLGGGVKDCWVTDQVGRLRDDCLQAVAEIGIDLCDYAPAEARAIAERALARSPCPVEPEQIEDVDSYLDLVRSRVALVS
ncbi:MAG: hypothetical protein ACRDP8_00370 [Actinopolymorphaceae bacterium]